MSRRPTPPRGSEGKAAERMAVQKTATQKTAAPKTAAPKTAAPKTAAPKTAARTSAARATSARTTSARTSARTTSARTTSARTVATRTAGARGTSVRSGAVGPSRAPSASRAGGQRRPASTTAKTTSGATAGARQVAGDRASRPAVAQRSGRGESGMPRVSPTSAARFAARARSARLLGWRPVLTTLATLASLGLVGWVVLGSPWLRVDSVAVQVEAPPAPLVATVTQQSVADVLDGVSGTPLALIDTADVADRVRSLPRVSEVSVVRQWPSGLQVRVVETVPVAAVPSGAGFRLLDDTGGVLADSPTVPTGVPSVQVDLQRATADTVTEVVAVLDALPEALRAEVETAGGVSPDAVRLTLRSGEQVVWGSADDSPLKVRVLAALREQEASVYDVSAPGAPSLR